MSDGMILDNYTCEDALQRLYEYLDRELPPVERARVEAHLARCGRCPERFDFDRRLLDAIRARCRNSRAPASVRRSVADLLARL